MHLPFDQLCSRCGLGRLTAVSPLSGGFLHKMFRLETEKGVFAAKALDPGIMTRPAAPGNFRFSETVTRRAMEAGLPALPAIPVDGDVLIRTGEQFWMLFPWQDGRSLRPDEVTPAHAEKIGGILGRLHSLLPAPDEAPDLPVYHWEQFCGLNMPWSGTFAQMLSLLRQWTDEGRAALLLLSSGRVMSHRDLDPKNVLWNGGDPCIIDWEAAGPVHPLQEMAETALCWSDDGKNEEALGAFLAGYRKYAVPDPALTDAALSAVILGRLDWLYYNLGRSLGAEGADEESRTVGVQQTELTLKGLAGLQNTLPLLKRYCRKE